MRSEQEMMDLILSTAKEDDRIRAVYLSSSRVDQNAPQDKYSDFDSVYIVNVQCEIDHKEPRKLFLDKNGINGLDTIEVGHHYYIQKPTAEEYRDCCNEFWLLSTYTAKGLCREELMYAKSFMERYEMDMFF